MECYNFLFFFNLSVRRREAVTRQPCLMVACIGRGGLFIFETAQHICLSGAGLFGF